MRRVIAPMPQPMSRATFTVDGSTGAWKGWLCIVCRIASCWELSRPCSEALYSYVSLEMYEVLDTLELPGWRTHSGMDILR